MKVSKRFIVGIFGASVFAIGLFMHVKHHLALPSNTIKEINFFSQADDILNNADKNTLVLFDVDDTLIAPRSIVLRPKITGDEKYLPWLQELMSTVYTNAKKSESYYESIILAKEIFFLIEPKIAQVIQILQDRGVKVMALTTLSTGSYFTIPSVPAWRFNSLKKLDIDFSKSNFPDINFNELPSEDGHFPMLYSGILCTASASKDQVLGAFLDRIKWKPDQVIFFDDSIKRVEQVAEEMHKREIKFHGYKYNGVEFIPGELDKKVTNLQFKHLVAHEEWLSEDEARSLLKKESSLTCSH